MGIVYGLQAMSVAAITAYSNFLCSYGLLHAEMLPTDAIQCATRMWWSLSPEEQLSYALMHPYHPNCFQQITDSEYIRPPCAVALPRSKTKSKLKAKTPAKCRTKKKQTPAASKGMHKSPKKKRMAAYKGTKSKAKTRKEPTKTGFQIFLKKLREKHSEITEEEIVKKAARAWCNMNQRQREIFLR